MVVKQPGIEEQLELVREQVDTYHRWWVEANARIRDLERRCEQLKAELAQAQEGENDIG